MKITHNLGWWLRGCPAWSDGHQREPVGHTGREAQPMNAYSSFEDYGIVGYTYDPDVVLAWLRDGSTDGIMGVRP